MRRVGILGAAAIAPTGIVQPVRRRDDVELAAVAARRPGAAEAFAREHDIPSAYASYRELVDDASIDIVYVALAVSEHAEWSIAALEAGKDVLVEKPAAMNAREAARMAEAAARSGRRLVEAFHYRHHPLFAHVEALVRSGRLGAIRSLRTELHDEQVFDPRSIALDPAVGGGVLMHAGCYPVDWMRALTGTEPRVISASATLNPLGADETITAELDFGGVHGSILASFGPAGGHRQGNFLVIEAENGRVEVDNVIAPHGGHSVRSWIDGVYRVNTVSGDTSYDHQLDAFLRALDTGEVLPSEGEALVLNLSAIDAIYASAGVSTHLA